MEYKSDSLNEYLFGATSENSIRTFSISARIQVISEILIKKNDPILGEYYSKIPNDEPLRVGNYYSFIISFYNFTSTSQIN